MSGPVGGVLVTGGSGFCGWEIVRLFVSRGRRVRSFDVEPPSGPVEGFEHRAGDVRDAAAVDAALEDVDTVVHAAAKVPVSKAGKGFRDVNVGGTRNVLEASLRRGVRKVVHVSSSAVQSFARNPVDEDAPYAPIGAYARSKRDAEQVCATYRAKGLDVDVIRPRTVIGPGRLGIFDILFDWVAAGKRIYVLGDGSNVIQFLDVRDLAECCLASAGHPGAGTYNVGSRSYGPLRGELEALIRHAGTRSRVVGLPERPAIAVLAALDALRLSPLSAWHYRSYSKDFYFTNARAKEILGWEPRRGNRDILAEAYDAYLASRAAAPPFGTSHRRRLRQRLLGCLRRVS